ARQRGHADASTPLPRVSGSTKKPASPAGFFVAATGGPPPSPWTTGPRPKPGSRAASMWQARPGGSVARLQREPAVGPLTHHQDVVRGGLRVGDAHGLVVARAFRATVMILGRRRLAGTDVDAHVATATVGQHAEQALAGPHLDAAQAGVARAPGQAGQRNAVGQLDG